MRWLISFVVVCSLARPAKADLASSLYGDVRDVIEELIQTEVTTSVVRTVGDRSPALAFYMHGTLERLGSPYWGSLGRVLKDDLTIAVSDFVYWHISTGGGDGDIVASAKRFFGCAKSSGDAGSEQCKRLLEAVSVQHRPLLEVECRRAKPKADRRIACHIGLAVLAALQGRGEVRHHLVDALSDIVLLEVADTDLGSRMRDILARWLDLPKDLPAPLLEALGNPDLSSELTDESIEKRCTDPKLVDALIKDPSGAMNWVCFAVTHPSLPAALGAEITINDGAHAARVKIDYWVIQTALKDYDADRASDDTAFRLFAELAFETHCPAGNTNEGWPCKGTRLAPGSTVGVTWLGQTVVGTTSKAGPIETKPSRGMMLPLLRFRKLIHRIEELRALVPPSLQSTLFYAGSTPGNSKSALRSAHRMARLVSELRSRWYLWSQSHSQPGSPSVTSQITKTFEELDIAELLRVARASLAHGDDDKTPTNPALAFLEKHATGASTLDIGDWLRMVMRADYRSLAMESLRAALDLPLSGGGRPHERFFLSLAAYLLDNSEGVGEAVARSAFRAAAKELLLSASHKGVPRVGDRLRFRILPRLAIRLSFNDIYAVTDGDSRRRTVAADWPTVMVAFNDYIGFELSAIDPLAPLSEMALRPPGTYKGYEYVVLDAIRPRLGTWIAVPQFSKRLTLSSGFGARFLDLVREDDGSGPLVARYGYKASLTFDAGLQFVF